MRGKRRRKRRRKDKQVETWHLLEEPAECRSETVSPHRGRHRSEGFLGTIKFLWWQPWLGGQATKVELRVLRAKRGCLQTYGPSQGTEVTFRVLRAKRWCLRTYGDWSAQESRWGGRQAGVGGPQGGGVLLGGLSAVGAWLTAWGTPTAAATSAVLVVVELRVISGRRLGAAIQEVGERVGDETHLGGWCGLFVSRIVGCSIQVP